MIQPDIAMLTDRERELLDDSFYRQAMARRVRGIFLSTFVVLTAVVLFGQWGLSVPWFAAIAGTILVISAAEKVSYQNTMLTYESVIRKLVHRVEALEGVQLTPDETRPSSIVKIQKAS